MHLFRALILSIVAFILNEVVYYDYNLSLVINVIILFIPLLLTKKYGLDYSFLITIIFSGILLSARPRELHLLPIEYRGAFEYYSFHSQKLFLFSFSTTAMIFYGLLVIVNKNFKVKTHPFLNTLLILSVMSQLSGLIANMVMLNYVVSDLRWLVALFFGINLTFYKSHKKSFHSHLKILIYSTVILTIVNIISDLTVGELKFKYSINYIYLVPIVAISLLVKLNQKDKILFNVPATTTDIFLFAGLFFDKVKKHKWIIVLGAILIGAFLTTSKINPQELKQDTFTAFVLRESKLNPESVLDKSSLVRLYELKSFWDLKNHTLLFGRGYGGFFELNDFPLNLNKTDFPEAQLLNKKLSQPHTFVSYLLIKFGFFGFLIFIYNSFRFTTGNVFFRVLFVISVLSSFYWVPVIAFIWGVYISLQKNIHNE